MRLFPAILLLLVGSIAHAESAPSFTARFPAASCSAGDFLTWNATTKVSSCATPAGGLASVFADAPLAGNGTSGSHLSIPAATDAVNGYLSAADHTTFNGKLGSVTVDAPLTGAGTSVSHLACPTATGAQAGCLAAADWTTFNNKQDAISLPLSIASGGTAGTATPTAGGLCYGTGSAYAFTGAGTTGQAVVSGGTGAATFGSYDGITSDTQQFRWDRESSTTPGLGTWSTITESGITGASLTQSSTSGNHLEITQTDGDASYAHFNGYYLTSTVANDMVARALFRAPGAGGTAMRYGVHVRSASTAGCLNGYVCWVGGTGGSGGTVYLDKRTTCAISNLRTSAVALTTILPAYAVAQDSLEIVVSAIGPWISCSVNGVLYARVNDTTYTSGVAGIGTLPHNGVGTDTKASIDTFEVFSVSTGTSFFRAH